jgi:hypothetical protein
MGDGRIFLKRLGDASFNKIYRMSLISTGSISLDSTFKDRFRRCYILFCFFCLQTGFKVCKPLNYGRVHFYLQKKMDIKKIFIIYVS